MKRFLLATVALAALSAPAAAADLATKYPVKAVAVPVFSWTGFYIGANVGYGGDKFNYNAYDPAGLVTGIPGFSYADASITSSGFFAGGQIGYNYQFANNVVLGIETDLQWSDIKGEVALGVNPLLFPVGVTAGSSIDYFGTIRVRLGYAIDRFLPYITGGLAYGKTSNDVTLNLGGFPFGFSDSSTSWGWTIGAGGEFAITNNWTFKAEYLYVDLGDNDIDLSGLNALTGFPVTSVVGLSNDSKFHTFKAGVNYKF